MTMLHNAHPNADPKEPSRQADTIDFEAAKRQFLENGYVVFRGVVDPDWLTQHNQQLFAEFDRLNDDGPLFAGGGGMVMGHLNCFPGEQVRFVYDTLVERGIIDLVRALWPRAVRLPNVGCNFNLPRSNPQNYHMDGYAADAFPILNIASVDTDRVNGALDVLERTHSAPFKYWQIVVDRPKSLRLPLKQGDVMIRSSMLWHRGMPNRSCRARPMLAFTWEDGGSSLDDPFKKNAGKIAFYPNRYGTNVAGKVREHAYVLAPGVNSIARFAASLVQRR
jgi:ectoine hydroxylase-related dioxygenase (phytanoyl-CoA dioxygenase family)